MAARRKKKNQNAQTNVHPREYAAQEVLATGFAVVAVVAVAFVSWVGLY